MGSVLPCKERGRGGWRLPGMGKATELSLSQALKQVAPPLISAGNCFSELYLSALGSGITTLDKQEFPSCHLFKKGPLLREEQVPLFDFSL